MGLEPKTYITPVHWCNVPALAPPSKYFRPQGLAQTIRYLWQVAYIPVRNTATRRFLQRISRPKLDPAFREKRLLRGNRNWHNHRDGLNKIRNLVISFMAQKRLVHVLGKDPFRFQYEQGALSSFF